MASKSEITSIDLHPTRLASRRLLVSASTSIVLGFVLVRPALAIPSPDVVLSLFASAAQVLGLLTVVLGGWFWRSRSNIKNAGGSSKGWRIAFLSCGGLFAACAVGWMLYAADVADQKARRLQVNLERSSKEDGKTVGDVSLKELAFSDQQKRKDGIQTVDLQHMIAAGTELQTLDVREDEEYELGRIHGAKHVRFPDLLEYPERYADASRPLLLLCFNGNRSSELATELESKGFDCRFMIGGYEKWLAEDRALDLAKRTGGELREVAEFPNKHVLLETADVLAMTQGRDVQFIDVRYPGEFTGLGHLPGAINLPARKLNTADLEKAIAALPKKPMIVACYDKRSSFYGLILGLKLSRAGYEFLGRYTTPESYSLPAQDKPHVALWKKNHVERTLMSVAAEPLAGSMSWMREHLGSLALAILALALCLRMAILPLTLKADRDRLVQERLAPRLAELRKRYAGDRRGESRATLKLYREHGVRPIVGLAGSIVQLVLFMLFFGVVDAASKGSEEPFLWIKNLSEADRWMILPTLAGLFIGAQIVATASRITVARFALALAVSALVFGLLVKLNAGVGLYLSTSLGFLLLQTLAARFFFAKGTSWFARRATHKATAADVLPMALAEHAPECGNKVLRLARMAAAGLPVPSGFVVRSRAVAAFLERGEWTAAERTAIRRQHAALGVERVAVRSSGANEDGADKSYAGVFESVLDVQASELFRALGEVARSLSSTRAQVYSGSATERGSILVQTMVPAEFAGVLFTEHPGESGAALVELVAGLGDQLVSGQAQPEAFRLGRHSGRLLDTSAPPIDLRPLFALAQQVEALFGRPQDIEWAYANGRFFLLQSRDITRTARSGEDTRAIRERERSRVLEGAWSSAGLDGITFASLEPNEAVLVRTELCELLPRPTPASISLLNQITAFGGSTDLACRELGIAYAAEPGALPQLVPVFGACYADVREAARRASGGVGTLASFRLARSAETLERDLREHFLPEHTRSARLQDALDLGRLGLGDLVQLLRDVRTRFITDSYQRAEVINLAADFYVKGAVRALEKEGLDPAMYLGNTPRTVVHEAMEILARVQRDEADLSAFLKEFGHRSPLDYELAEPRYRETPQVALAMASRSTDTSTLLPAKEPAPPKKKVLRLAIDRARRFQSLKEEAKHAALRDVAFLRRVLLELGDRLELGEGVFQLALEELERLDQAGFRQREAVELVRLRQEEADALGGVELPTSLSISMLETLDVERGSVILAPRVAGDLRGTRISGSGEIVARARVLRHAHEIDGFQKGEILVARFTDPTWMPVFPLCAGLITEVGGWLSHAAIQAREYGITGIVGVEGALDTIQTGDLVRLTRAGQVERLPDRRRENRREMLRQVIVGRERESIQGRISDVSGRGALLVVVGHKLEIGEEIAVQGLRELRPMQATVVRNGTPGHYGLLFRETYAA